MILCFSFMPMKEQYLDTERVGVRKERETDLQDYNSETEY